MTDITDEYLDEIEALRIDPQWVQLKVDRIATLVDDPEKAHGDEDALHREVLYHIAAGSAENPVECARIALKTRNLNFSRWYA